MDNQSYTWTDNPTVSGVSPCNTDVLNDCLMHLKYNSQNGDGFRLFDIKITDRKLIGEEAVGWVIQGGLVTMTYPDAVNQITEEFDEGVSVTYREISCVQSLTGHYIADISQKDAIDQLFYQTGIADFYILDKTNQQFYLPRNNWFMQFTTDDTKLNQFNEAGLPNHQHSPIYLTGSNADLGDPGNCYITNNGQQNGVRTSTNSRTGDVSNNGLYGKSDTVQPQSTNKFLYYKVGNVSTSPNQILIDAQEFLADSVQELEDTVDEGLGTLSNASNSLRQTQITNCVLEAPDPAAGFTSDTLTLKQGVKLLVPNGRNSDGTLNNIEYILSEDISKTLTAFSNTTENLFFVYDEQTPDLCLQSLQTTGSGLLKDRPDDGSLLLYYAADTNYWYSYSDNIWNTVYLCKVGVVQQSDSAITFLNVFQPIHLLDYSAKEFISNQAYPSRHSIQLSTPVDQQIVKAPADGYFTLNCESNGAAVTGLNNASTGVAFWIRHDGALVCFVPASKGDKVAPVRLGKYNTFTWKFIYSNGGNLND